MILDQVKNLPQFFNFHPLLAPIWEFLSQERWCSLEDGKYPLLEDRLIAIVEKGQGKGPAGSTLEAHRRYLDLQMCLEGRDLIGWRPLAECKRVQQPYEPSRDILFFEERPLLWVPVHSEQFAIFSPEDAHAPLACEGPVRKLIFKIAVQNRH